MALIAVICCLIVTFTAFGSTELACSLKLLNSSNPLEDGFSIKGPLTVFYKNNYGHNSFTDQQNLHYLGNCMEAMVSYKDHILRTSVYCLGAVALPAEERPTSAAALSWKDCTKTEYGVYLDRVNGKILLTANASAVPKNNDLFGAFTINMDPLEARARYARFRDEDLVLNFTKCSCNNRNDFEVSFAVRKSSAMVVTLGYVSVLIGIVALVLVICGCAVKIMT